MTKRHRSAVDGKYVTAEQAKADPERTVSERVATIEARMPDGAGSLSTPGMAVSERSGLGRELLVLQLLEHESRIEALEVAVAELRGRV